MAELKRRFVRVLRWCLEPRIQSLIDLHLFLNLVLRVADNIWTAILVLLNESLLNPFVNERGGSLVSLCFLVQLWQLSLENLDMLTLIFDLGGIGLAIRLSDIFKSKLGLHIDLSSTPFTSRFENVNTSSLCGYDEIQKESENLWIIILDYLTYYLYWESSWRLSLSLDQVQ